MAKLFQADGVRFLYPDNWKLTREDAETGWTATVQSPTSAFFMLSLDSEMSEVGDVVEAVLEAMRSDYPQLEAEEAVESLVSQPAIGHDMQFFSLDLTVTCVTRCFYAETGTVLVMWQASDLDLEEALPAFQSIRASLGLEAVAEGE